MERQPQIAGYPISDFLMWQASGQLEITPKFQRRAVWTPKARSYLIDTILRKMPMPPLFIRLIVDSHKQRAVRQVVDGQQRLRTILDFINGKFTVLKVHNPEFAGETFSELPENVQRDFLLYYLPVSQLGGVSDSEVLSMFARLNTYTVALNKQELRNSLFFGAFKSTVYELGYQHLAFWRNNNILLESDIARMRDAELVSILVVTMLDGIQTTKDADLRKYYKKFDDDFPEETRIRSEFERTIDTVGSLFGDELAQTPYHRLPLFFSLFCFTYDALFGLPGCESPRLSFSKKENRLVAQALTDLGRVIQSRQPDPQYIPLIEAARRGTADVGKRRLRHDYLWKAVSHALNLPTPRIVATEAVND